ncbi:hypothetical protein E1298_24495, partial [Actinomadura rubrisoli]
TDSLEMAGARRKYGDAAVPVRAIGAGADQLLMPPDLPRAYNAAGPGRPPGPACPARPAPRHPRRVRPRRRGSPATSRR